FSAGTPAGTLKKKLIALLRAMVPEWVMEKLFAAENCSAASTVCSVGLSMPVVAGSSRFRIAEWVPALVGCTVTVRVFGEFSGSAMARGAEGVHGAGGGFGGFRGQREGARR